MNETHIEVEQAAGTDRVWVPLDIPSALNTDEHSNAYATKFCGWTPTITNDVGEVIDNPESSRVAIAKRLRNFLREEYRAMAADSGAEAGRQSALEQFDSLFAN